MGRVEPDNALIQVRIRPSIKLKLMHKVREDGRTISSWLRAVIDDYLAQPEQKPKLSEKSTSGG